MPGMRRLGDRCSERWDVHKGCTPGDLNAENSACRSRYARPSTVARVGGSVRPGVRAVPRGRSKGQASPDETPGLGNVARRWAATWTVLRGRPRPEHAPEAVAVDDGSWCVVEFDAGDFVDGNCRSPDVERRGVDVMPVDGPCVGWPLAASTLQTLR